MYCRYVRSMEVKEEANDDNYHGITPATATYWYGLTGLDGVRTWLYPIHFNRGLLSHSLVSPPLAGMRAQNPQWLP